jgi:hypothetical protein
VGISRLSGAFKREVVGMARVIPEVYIQVDGKVYVSRDFIDPIKNCQECAFNSGGTGRLCVEFNDRFLCGLLNRRWKELEDHE